MSTRDDARDVVEAAIDFGHVTATELSSENEVRASIAGAGGDDEIESVDDQEMVAPLGVAARPVDDASGEHVEVLLMRRGDEVIVIAGRDRRMRVTIAKGEVILSNLNPDTPARVRMKETGEVAIEASKVGAVAPGDAFSLASKALALAELVDNRLSAIRSWANSHTHVAGTLVAGATAVTGATGAATSLAALASTAGARVFSKD